MNEKKIKVCLIEDDPLISEAYGTELKRWDFEVGLAENGTVGMKKLKNENFDIALVDIMLPEKDGIQMIKEIRAIEKLKNLPIIFLTNLDDSDTVKKTADLNAAFYLVKSNYRPSDVVKIVKEVLGDVRRPPEPEVVINEK